jgi:hypothetical protein
MYNHYPHNRYHFQKSRPGFLFTLQILTRPCLSPWFFLFAPPVSNEHKKHPEKHLNTRPCFIKAIGTQKNFLPRYMTQLPVPDILGNEYRRCLSNSPITSGLTQSRSVLYLGQLDYIMSINGIMFGQVILNA